MNLQLKKGKEKSIINRHPWIFSGAIQPMKGGQEGDIVSVIDSENKLLGYGFLSIKSQIVCRMFEWDVLIYSEINAEYWYEKIAKAYALRKALINSEETNTYRLLHAEGDFFPGIIADVYDKVVVVQLLIKGTERIASTIIEGLSRCGFEHIYLKAKTSSLVLEDIRTESG
jgi:23S rRNA (cytosine1962-C5)-methyltransferase